MAPPSWASQEQHNWLNTQLPVYSQHVTSGNVRRFWPKLYREWAKNFPEIDHLIAQNILPAHAKLPSGKPGDTSYDDENQRSTWTAEYEKLYQDAILEREKVFISALLDLIMCVSLTLF